MLLYNSSKSNQNPFGFDDINGSSCHKINIQSRAIKRTTSSKSLKNKLTRENIAFLKSLGLKVRA